MRASQIFGAVDPNLTVIDGGRRRAIKKDWKAAGGAICPRCQQEAVRFRPSDGFCPGCARVFDEKMDKDESKHAKFLEHVKKHNARIDGQKKKGAQSPLQS